MFLYKQNVLIAKTRWVVKIHYTKSDPILGKHMSGLIYKFEEQKY